MKKINSHGYALEYREGTRWNEKNKSWYMECKICSEMTKVGNEDVDKVTCSRCVSRGLKEFEENARS
tara:strand:- start:733 stop:933 length:201 start_codon:yes stop_codon:yes gene_type:complete